MKLNITEFEPVWCTQGMAFRFFFLLIRYNTRSTAERYIKQTGP